MTFNDRSFIQFYMSSCRQAKGIEQLAKEVETGASRLEELMFVPQRWSVFGGFHKWMANIWLMMVNICLIYGQSLMIMGDNGFP